MRLFGYSLHVDLGSQKVWVLLQSFPVLFFSYLGGEGIANGLRTQLVWEKTEGSVIGIDYLGGYRRKIPFARFSFTTRDGRIVHARVSHTSAFHPARIGDITAVAYSPHAPENADLMHAGHLYGFPLLQLLTAAFFAWLTVRHFDGAIHLLGPEKPAPQPPKNLCSP